MTSKPGRHTPPQNVAAAKAVEDAARAGHLREILWSHAMLEQYVPLRFGPRGTRIAFDVGRYDAYGVYRFDALVALALEQPDEVIAALAPLVADADDAIEIDPASETKRGPRP